MKRITLYLIVIVLFIGCVPDETMEGKLTLTKISQTSNKVYLKGNLELVTGSLSEIEIIHLLVSEDGMNWHDLNRITPNIGDFYIETQHTNGYYYYQYFKLGISDYYSEDCYFYSNTIKL
ncbi:MAG: hypothetical protein PHI14_00450 [Bacteroidales bacterium]|nr:hypothetical protein [Bacteroidales bacterium]